MVLQDLFLLCASHLIHCFPRPLKKNKNMMKGKQMKPSDVEAASVGRFESERVVSNY